MSFDISSKGKSNQPPPQLDWIGAPKGKDTPANGKKNPAKGGNAANIPAKETSKPAKGGDPANKPARETTKPAKETGKPAKGGDPANKPAKEEKGNWTYAGGKEVRFGNVIIHKEPVEGWKRYAPDKFLSPLIASAEGSYKGLMAGSQALSQGNVKGSLGNSIGVPLETASGAAIGLVASAPVEIMESVTGETFTFMKPLRDASEPAFTFVDDKKFLQGVNDKGEAVALGRTIKFGDVEIHTLKKDSADRFSMLSGIFTGPLMASTGTAYGSYNGIRASFTSWTNPDDLPAALFSWNVVPLVASSTGAQASIGWLPAMSFEMVTGERPVIYDQPFIDLGKHFNNATYSMRFFDMHRGIDVNLGELNIFEGGSSS